MSEKDIERGSKPGVCEYCGYRIRPDVEDVEVVGPWNFAHKKCENGIGVE